MYLHSIINWILSMCITLYRYRRSITWSSFIWQLSYICSSCFAVLSTSTCRNIFQTLDNCYGMTWHSLSLALNRFIHFVQSVMQKLLTLRDWVLLPNDNISMSVTTSWSRLVDCVQLNGACDLEITWSNELGCRILPTQPHLVWGDFQVTCSTVNSQQNVIKCPTDIETLSLGNNTLILCCVE